MNRLTRIDLAGFKTIRQLVGLELGPVNVLIGANGAGKSNFISFFKLLSWMTPSPGNLQLFVGRVGGASALLHDGATRTPQIEAALTFDTSTGVSEYRARLFHAALDTLIFADEQYRYCKAGMSSPGQWHSLGSGHRESAMLGAAERGDKTAKTILFLLKQCVVYQFHNTSETARMRQRWNVDDNRFLKEDGANLAPLLRRLREVRPASYGAILDTIRVIAPFFGDFELEPQDGTVLLQWREQGSDVVFGPHQASDGMLRTIALVTLLLLPADELPFVLVPDEPELGLHPFAIEVLGGLIRSASQERQVILATQSIALVNQFQPGDIIVVDRQDRESLFRRLDEKELEAWLADYSLAELWEKNVLGGRP